MKIAVQILVTALLTLVVFGCSYTDPDIYYVEPIPGDSVTVVVTTNLDTVELAQINDSLLFTFRAEIEGGKFYAAQASVENQLIYANFTEYDSDTIIGPFVLTGSFWIKQDLDAGPGVSSMLLEIFHSANTNSLADVLGIEVDIFELEYAILVEGGDK
jgi:hypothetical protein